MLGIGSVARESTIGQALSVRILRNATRRASDDALMVPLLSLCAEGQVRSTTDTSAAAPGPWRRILRRHLTVLLVIKLAALTLLWALFFSPAHRTSVDAATAGRHLTAAAQDERR